MKTIGIIGAGNFGKFMATHLMQYTEVETFDKNQSQEQLKIVCQKDVLIFSVPFFALEGAIDMVKPYIGKDSLILDVTSIKTEPLNLLKQAFPKHSIIGTHPIFGPESGKHSISGLPIMITNVSTSKDMYEKTKIFLSQELQLKVIEQTPEQHDKEMAYIQGLSHLIGRALKNIDIVDFDTSTSSYKQLISLKNLLKNDSWELFRTIQEGNPYAGEVRKQFINEINRIEEELS